MCHCSAFGFSFFQNFYLNRLKDPEKVARADRDPKTKMSMVFRWYLSKSSGWANRGDSGRESDYQIWCGPCIGSFNSFIKGSYLDPAVASEYPCVVQTNLQLMRGGAYLQRLQYLRRCCRGVGVSQDIAAAVNGTLDSDEVATYTPGDKPLNA